jgi:hypothetical protein
VLSTVWVKVCGGTRSLHLQGKISAVCYSETLVTMSQHRRAQNGFKSFNLLFLSVGYFLGTNVKYIYLTAEPKYGMLLIQIENALSETCIAFISLHQGKKTSFKRKKFDSKS